MATNQNDLWPKIIPLESNLNPPVNILREQATLLKDKTDELFYDFIYHFEFPTRVLLQRSILSHC